MKLISVYRFIRWEVVKNFLRIRDFIDKHTWKPSSIIDISCVLQERGSKSSFYFIQVGANDGITDDRLHAFICKYKWQGILVEPVPYIFERLQENYKNFANLVFENCAIGSSSGNLPFYSISEKNWVGTDHKDYSNGKGLDQLGSFDKATIMKHSSMIPDFESFILEINVPTVTISELYRKYNITHLDLLQIDTEGYDYEILTNTDFVKLKPEIVIFEHQHMLRGQYKSLINRFKQLNYNIFIDGRDTICMIY
jgi:FkbM family methyltransferase